MKRFSFSILILICSCVSIKNNKYGFFSHLPYGVNVHIERVRTYPSLNNLTIWTISKYYIKNGDITYIVDDNPYYLLGFLENGSYYKLRGYCSDSSEYNRLIKDLGIQFDSPQKIIDYAKLYYAYTFYQNEYEVVENYSDLRNYWQTVYKIARISIKVGRKSLWDAIPLDVRDSIVSVKEDSFPDQGYKVMMFIATTGLATTMTASSKASISRVTIHITREGKCGYEPTKNFWKE